MKGVTSPSPTSFQGPCFWPLGKQIHRLMADSNHILHPQECCLTITTGTETLMVHSMPVRPDDLGMIGYMEKAENFISVSPLIDVFCFK